MLNTGNLIVCITAGVKQKWVPMHIETVHRDRPGRGRRASNHRPYGGDRWSESRGRGRRQHEDGPRSDRGIPNLYIMYV